MNPGLAALARPGDVQRRHLVRVEPIDYGRRIGSAGEVNDQVRLAQSATYFDGQLGAAGGGAHSQDERRVRIAHVPPGALRLACHCGFGQGDNERGWWRPRLSPLWAPAAAVDAQFQRHVEGGQSTEPLNALVDVTEADWRNRDTC